MEGPIAIVQEPEVVLAKQEQDRTFESRSTDESGFQSSYSSQSNEADSSWLMLKGETMDPTLFDPPIHHSSNLDGPDSAMLCNISSISGEEIQYKGNAF